MSKRLAMLVTATTILVVVILLGQRLRPVEAQDKKLASIAAVHGAPGGQDMFGAYDFPTGPSLSPDCRAMKNGPGAPARASSPRAPTASSYSSAASCRTSTDPRQSS